MLERDVSNLATYFSQFAPQLAGSQYGKEIWALYVAGLLQADSVLTGRIAQDKRPANVGAVLHEIQLARQEEEERVRYQQET
jgi:RIO kinase 1